MFAKILIVLACAVALLPLAILSDVSMAAAERMEPRFECRTDGCEDWPIVFENGVQVVSDGTILHKLADGTVRRGTVQPEGAAECKACGVAVDVSELTTFRS